MKRPDDVPGFTTPWVEYADYLEAEYAALRSASEALLSSRTEHIVTMTAVGEDEAQALADLVYKATPRG